MNQDTQRVEHRLKTYRYARRFRAYNTRYELQEWRLAPVTFSTENTWPSRLNIFGSYTVVLCTQSSVIKTHTTCTPYTPGISNERSKTTLHCGTCCATVCYKTGGETTRNARVSKSVIPGLDLDTDSAELLDGQCFKSGCVWGASRNVLTARTLYSRIDKNQRNSGTSIISGRTPFMYWLVPVKQELKYYLWDPQTYQF